MALRQVRIGPLSNVVQYDDGDFANAIETDQPIKAGPPVDPADVLRLGDMSSTPAEIDDAVAKRHTQGTDVALGALGTKNPPIDADKAVYRDSTSADALVTSTWSQIKAFLKTYFDTLYIYRTAGTLADDASVALPTITADYSAKCEVVISSAGVIDANATFLIDSTGNVTPQIESTGNVVYNVDTDAMLCIGTAAAQNPLSIKNRLGGSKKYVISMVYN